MKPFGLAIIMYAQDYDERTPGGLRPTFIEGRNTFRGLGWATQIHPYVVRADNENTYDRNPYVCPDDQTPDDPNSGQVISYAFNEDIARAPGDASLDNPATTVMLFEVSGAHARIKSWPTASQIASDPLAPVGDGNGLLSGGMLNEHVILATGNIGGRPLLISSIPRHTSGTNYLIADGHVKYLAPDQVSSGDEAINSDAQQTGTFVGRAAGTLNRRYQATFSTR
jgi:prepilin-type processing-associated H-X9-DG protein